MDTYDEDELVEVNYLMNLYASIGYEVIGISAKKGEEVDRVKEKMIGKDQYVFR